MEIINELLLTRTLEQLTQAYEEIAMTCGKTGSEFDIKLMPAARRGEIEKRLPGWLRRLKRSSRRRVTQVLIKVMWEAQQDNLVFRVKGLAALLDRLVDEDAAMDIVKYCASRTA